MVTGAAQLPLISDKTKIQMKVKRGGQRGETTKDPFKIPGGRKRESK